MNDPELLMKTEVVSTSTKALRRARPGSRSAEVPGGDPPSGRRLYESIALEIENSIFRRTLRPGDRLLPERELAARYGASRVVVREALRSLQVKGLLEVRHGAGGGHFIGRFGGDLLENGLRSLAILGNVTVAHLSELRVAIEPQVARLAAVRATERDIAAMRSLLEERASKSASPADIGALDLEFHRQVADASKNPLCMALLNSLMRLEVDLVLSSIRFDHHDHDQVDSSHHQIFEAIAAKNADAAESAMLAHTLDLYHRKVRAGSAA